MQSLYGAIANYKLKKNMAVSVDKVYQKVLAIANKEQRGYITPQEFNLFADHAQMDIFRQYFYDLSQFRRRPGNDTNYADITNIIEEKIADFSRYENSAGVQNSVGDINLTSQFNNSDGEFEIHKITQVRFWKSNGESFEIDETKISNQHQHYSKSPLIQNASKSNLSGYYILHESNSNDRMMKVYPHPNSSSGDYVTISYIRKPQKPNWTYVINGDTALFSENVDFRDFELHSSEENMLVIKILQLAGVNMKDNNIVQLATQEEIKKIQQEKQ